MNEDLLGPAEKHIVGEFKDVVRSATKSARELFDELEKIDLDSGIIEQMMLDADGKKTLIATLPGLQSLNHNLSQAVLVPAIIAIILSRKEDKR
jgi:hypothetical protein